VASGKLWILERMRSTLLLALLWVAALISLAPDAQAQRRGTKGPKPEAIPYFDGQLDAALLQSKERNTPILIVCCKEGEEANDRFREQLRDNGSFAAALGGALVILVNDGTHERKQVTRRGPDGKKKRVEVCEAYHTPSCDHHKRNWDGVYRTFLSEHGDGSWPLPCALILAPDGSMQTLVATGEPPSDDEMLKSLKLTRAKHGPSITLDELKRVKELMQDGQAMDSAKAWPDAWHAWNGVLLITERGRLAEQALEGRAAAEQGLRARLEEFEKDESPPDVRYPVLAEFAARAAGTPVHKAASLAVKALERHPDIDKGLVKRVKLELEAEALLRDARALLRAGDEKAARRVLKKLAGSKYAGTPAAAEGKGLVDD
jgi:hypothetical protein